MDTSKTLFILKLILTYLIVLLPLQLIGIIILPIFLIFSLKDQRFLSNSLIKQRLPRYMRFFDVGDPIDRVYGLNGDIPHQHRSLGDSIANPSGWDIFKMRYNWLALRNPVNWFQYNVLGVKVDNMDRVLYYYNKAGDEETTIIAKPVFEKDRAMVNLVNIERFSCLHEVGNWHNYGTRDVFVRMKTGEIKREYYRVILYPKFITIKGKRKCMRIRLGHKFGHNPMVHPYRESIQWVCTIGFLSTYLGKV